MDRDAMLSYAAQAYGANQAVLDAINTRENSGRLTFDLNEWDSNAKAGTPSGGGFQFIEPTFNSYAAEAKKANPKAWANVKLDWRNPMAQALAASWAITNGKGSAWSTYQKALADAGAKDARATGRPAAKTAAPAGHGLMANGPAHSVVAGLLPDDSYLKGFLERTAARNATAPASTPATAAPASQVGSGPGPGANYQQINAWAKANFGLVQDPGDSQSTGGKHAKGSYHYAGKADDYGDARNSPQQLMQLAAYARAHPEQFAEFYYNPANFAVINGKIVEGHHEPGHDNHAHVAVK